MSFQNGIFDLARDVNLKNRRYAAFVFSYFYIFPDKEEAFEVLVRLTEDEDTIVRQNAAYTFQTSFFDFSDKEKAWEVLLRLTEDKNSVVRQNAACAFETSFYAFPDKEKAWEVLLRLTEDKNSVVRQNAATAFNKFSDFPDKEKAWGVFVRLTEDEDSVVRQNAAYVFKNFSDFPDKEKAWRVFVRLTEDEDSVVRQNAAYVFRNFSDFPDKEKAWEVLLRLTEDKNSVVRQTAVFAFQTSFFSFLDKEKAWKVLLRLTEDEDSVVRQNAARAFNNFSDFPDKEKAWEVFVRLTNDEKSVVRQNAAYALRYFYNFPEKEKVWEVLLRLTEDANSVVRQNAVFVFPTNFSDFPDKEKALEVLLRLATDKSRKVRQNIAYLFHIIYPEVSQKDELLISLFELANDDFVTVRAVSNYSIAKVYVYDSLMASNEQEFKENYAKAIEHFKKSYSYAGWDRFKFCFTVHDIFFRIFTGDIKSVDDIRNSLIQWSYVKSEERKYLLEILGALGNVLEESLMAKNSGKDVREYKGKVLSYCNQADELIKRLKHRGVKEIAKKAKDQVEEEYLQTINILSKVSNLINKPELLEEKINLLFPIIAEYCELIKEPVIRDKIKMDVEEIKREEDPDTRYKLALRLLKDIKYTLELIISHKDTELSYKEDIIDTKNEESKKGWDLIKLIRGGKFRKYIKNSDNNTRKFLETSGLLFTISGGVSAIVYGVLYIFEYQEAMRESLIALVISFFLVLIILFKEKKFQ